MPILHRQTRSAPLQPSRQSVVAARCGLRRVVWQFGESCVVLVKCCWYTPQRAVSAEINRSDVVVTILAVQSSRRPRAKENVFLFLEKALKTPWFCTTAWYARVRMPVSPPAGCTAATRTKRSCPPLCAPAASGSVRPTVPNGVRKALPPGAYREWKNELLSRLRAPSRSRPSAHCSTYTLCSRGRASAVAERGCLQR